jgi:hypothetical protein
VAIARLSAHGAGGPAGRLQSLRNRRKGLTRRRCARQGGAAEVLQGFALLVTLLAELLVEGPLGGNPTGLGGEAAPALLHAAEGRGQLVMAIALWEDGHGLRIGGGQGGLSFTPGGWNTGDPLARRLRERVAVVRAIEGPIGHHVGGSIHGGPWLEVGTAHLAKGLGITAGATARCHQDGDPGLMRHHELPQDVVEVRAMIATIALGDGHNLGLGLRVAMVATIAMTARRVAGRIGWTQAQTLGGAHRQETVPCGHPLGGEGIHGATARIIMELGGGTAGRNEALGGLMMEDSGDKVEGLIEPPQAMEPHRLDGFPDGERSHFRVLVRRVVNDVANAQVVEHASHKAAVIQHLAMVRGRGGPHRLL